MTRLEGFLCALIVCLAGAISAGAQQAQVVYVAAADANVYAVNASGVPTPLIPAGNSNFNSSARFTSLAIGPNNIAADNAAGNTYFFLFACDTATDTVVRLRLSTAAPGSAASDVTTIATSVTDPVCGQVDSLGDLYLTGSDSGSGVYALRGASTGNAFTTTQVYGIDSFTGGGLAQKNTGDLLIVNKTAGSILRASFIGAIPAGATAPFAASSPSVYVSGLSSPNAIARIATGDFFVANQGTGAVLKFDPAHPESPAICATTPAGGNVTLSSVAASEDNFLYAAIASPSQNKRFVQVLNGATCAALASISLAAVPASSVAAVALPPVSAGPVAPPGTTLDSSGNVINNFHFGFSVFQVATTSNCITSVTQTPLSLGYVQGLVDGIGASSTWGGGQPIGDNGEKGFGTVYTVTASEACTPADVQSNVSIGALYDTTRFRNPRVIHCQEDFTGCQVAETSGVWPGGTIPADPTTSTRVPGFSQFFLANADLSGELGVFCGFQTPLSSTTDPATAPVFSSGQGLSVKFKLASGSVASCGNGPYVTDAQALISVARISPLVDGAATMFLPVTIVAQGSSTDSPPIFKFNSNSKNYQFSLSLKGYAKGTYSLTVTFLTNNAPYVTTYFAVQ